MKNTILLVDGNAYFFRAYYAFPQMINNKGVNINAIYGFFQMVNNSIKKYRKNNTSLFFVFDTKGKNFRHQLYKPYKDNRKKSPAELIKQIPILHAHLEALGFCIITKEGYEADDVIASLAKYFVKKNNKIIIFTSDKDLNQLINNDINVYNIIKKKLLNERYIVNNMRIYPKRIPDYIALAGDQSDNIPGVHGIGKEIATKLIIEFHSLKNIINNIHMLNERYKKKIIYNIDKIKLYYQLALLKSDINFLNYNFNKNKKNKYSIKYFKEFIGKELYII